MTASQPFALNAACRAADSFPGASGGLGWGATGRASYGTILTPGYRFFSSSPMAGRVTSALNDRFHTSPTVLPASVSSRGAMAVALAVLSPTGLTTLNAGSAGGSAAAASGGPTAARTIAATTQARVHM